MRHIVVFRFKLILIALGVLAFLCQLSSLLFFNRSVATGALPTSRMAFKKEKEPYTPLEIHMIGCNRPKSFFALFSQLRSATYPPDVPEIPLHIHIDLCDSHEELLKFANLKEWPYGEKFVTGPNVKRGLRSMWLHILGRGFPKVEGEQDTLILVLEDDMRISPNYYLWLHAVAGKYWGGGDNNQIEQNKDVIGFSLSPLRMEELKHPFKRFVAHQVGDDDSIYLANVPSSWGSAYWSSSLPDFIAFTEERLQTYDQDEDERPDCCV